MIIPVCTHLSDWDHDQISRSLGIVYITYKEQFCSKKQSTVNRIHKSNRIKDFIFISTKKRIKRQSVQVFAQEPFSTTNIISLPNVGTW